MTDLKESIVDSIKGFLLPELRKLQDGINELCTRMVAVEKQIGIMNDNISNNSRRIDNIGSRIDEMGARLDRWIDEMDARLDERIDTVRVEFRKVRMEMERLKREEAITADIIHRMEILEEKVLLGK